MGIYSSTCFFRARVKDTEGTKKQARGLLFYLQIFTWRYPKTNKSLGSMNARQ